MLVTTYKASDFCSPCAREAGSTESPRQVLYIIDRLNHRFGGAEGALERLSRLLPRERYRPSIICFSAGDEVHATFCCPVQVLPLNSLCSRAAVTHALWLHRYLRTTHTDIVHTFFPASDIWGALVAHLSGVPVILSSRRDMGILRTSRHRVAYRIVNSIFDKVQAVSDKVRDACVSADGLPADKVVTIRNGIDLDVIDTTPASSARAFLGISGSAPVVVTVANFRSVKGLDVLVRAAALVRQQVPECVFLVIGFHQDEDCVQQFFRLVAELQLERNVVAPGLRTDVVSLLKSADVFCLPSRSEGMPNALLEAMACGLPCVATAVGGTPEVISDGENGYLVPSERPDLLAGRILHLLKHPEIARQIGHAARRRIETRFTAEAMTSAFVNLYDELLAQHYHAVHS